MERALHAVLLLDQQGLPLPQNMVLDLIQRCSKAKDLSAGRQLYFLLSKNGLNAIAIIGNHLIRMFTSCGSLLYSHETFHKVAKPDAYTWNAIISAHAKLGQFDDAFDFYQSMQNTDIKPNIVTFLCILKACAFTRALQQGRLIHDHIIRSRTRGAIAIDNTLIDMYAKCGSIGEAERVFDGLTNQDVVSWGALVSGYVQHEHGLPALELFEKMQQTAVQPGKVVFLSVLKACTIINSSVLGRQIHDITVRYNFDLDGQVGSMLVEMYAKCGSFQEAHKVFNSIPSQDAVLWCSLIAGYSERGHELQVLELFGDMQKVTLQPDRVTFIFILKACGGINAFEHGWLIHNMIVKSFLEADKAVANSLIDMYAKWGDFKGASSIFSKLSSPDEVSWGAMIAGYVHHGQDHLALQFFEDMQQKDTKPDTLIFLLALKSCGNLGKLGKGNLIHQVVVEGGLHSDVVIANAVIDMYGKCAGLEEATCVFGSIPNKKIGSWDALIAAYSNNDECNHKALEIFEKVQKQGLKPSKGTFLGVLKVCVGLKASREGKCLHDELIRSDVVLDKVIENTIIDMYAKCGFLKEAHNVFSRMRKPNEVSWGAIIAGYVGHGKNFYALKLFEKMQLSGIQANAVVSSCILKACGNIGMMEHGRLIHDKVIRNGLVTNDVWNTLVDMYAKCGSTDEAQKVFDSSLSKDLLSWGALIAGYTQHNDGFRALDVYRKMQQENCKPNKAVLLCVLQACGTTGAFVEGRLVYMQIMEDGFELDAHLGNTLLDMYAKCGTMQEACYVFAMLPIRDMVSWGVLMAGYVRNNECKKVEECFKLMHREGLKPGDFIFTSILSACSHAGLLEEGLKHFNLMTIDHALLPGQKHYSCISDLLGRAGCFQEAVDVFQTMPMPPDIILWTSLLDSCKTHGYKRLGTQCFKELLDTDPDDASWYVLMLNICANAPTSVEAERKEYFNIWDMCTKI
eukprot:c24790_g10_i2 orf=358-3252(+)